jgi:hypothetical protein
LAARRTRAFQVHLVSTGISWPALNQTVRALRFLYGITLGHSEIEASRRRDRPRRRALFKGDTFATMQRFYTDGYLHRHFTPGELVRALAPLQVEQISKTHMSGRMLPLISRRLDEWAKRRWGWLLIAEVRR